MSHQAPHYDTAATGKLWQPIPKTSWGRGIAIVAAAWLGGVASAIALGRAALPPSSSSTRDDAPAASASASAPAAAASAPAAAAAPAPRATKGAEAVWRGTFDPGSNPRVTRQSVAPERSYYDTVRGGENAPSTLWQETLRSEEMNKYNFHALSRDGKTIQKEDLLRAFGQVDVDALAKDADTDGDGRISHADWLRMKSKLAEAYERAGK